MRSNGEALLVAAERIAYQPPLKARRIGKL
jgi:hypothetical protein